MLMHIASPLIPLKSPLHLSPIKHICHDTNQTHVGAYPYTPPTASLAESVNLRTL